MLPDLQDTSNRERGKIRGPQTLFFFFCVLEIGVWGFSSKENFGFLEFWFLGRVSTLFFCSLGFLKFWQIGMLKSLDFGILVHLGRRMPPHSLAFTTTITATTTTTHTTTPTTTTTTTATTTAATPTTTTSNQSRLQELSRRLQAGSKSSPRSQAGLVKNPREFCAYRHRISDDLDCYYSYYYYYATTTATTPTTTTSNQSRLQELSRRLQAGSKSSPEEPGRPCQKSARVLCL